MILCMGYLTEQLEYNEEENLFEIQDQVHVDADLEDDETRLVQGLI